MQLELHTCVIRPFTDADRASIVLHGNDRDVWLNLLDVFPHPYTDDDAREWLAKIAEQDPLTHFAIDVDGEAVGGIGLTLGQRNARRLAEIGYWLGRAYWGRGIMTDAVAALTAWAFASFDLCRIQAGVFEWNPASMRVLEKVGYVNEGTRRRSVVKDGKTIDQVMWARVLDAGRRP